MTGVPAETWRRFNFSSSPPWAFWVGGVILAAATARRASGYLPMSRAAARSIRLVHLTPLVFVALGAIFWIVAAISAAVAGNSSAGSAGSVYSAGFGLALMLMALFAFLLTHRFGPTGKVNELRPGHYDLIVDLQRVHPKFAAAVREHQLARAASAATPGGLQSAAIEVD